MGLGKHRELLAAGLGSRAAGTLAMCPAEVLRELFRIVLLELAVVIAEVRGERGAVERHRCVRVREAVRADAAAPRSGESPTSFYW